MVFSPPRVAHSCLSFLLLACLNLSVSSTAQRLYYPSGVQLSVNEDALVGWTLCYNASYFDASASAENILAACGPMDLMMIGASRPDEPGQIKLLAARRADDFFSNHTHTRADTFCTRFDLADRHQHNGAWWYNIDGSALGFAAKRNIYPCLGDDELDDCEHRMSWHQQQFYNGGYRLGCDVSAPEDSRKLVWKASNNCTLPGHVPSYLNGDFVGCVCEDPLAAFDDVAGECYVPCTGPLRQQEGAALGRCECAIEHLQGESVANCRCPTDAVFDGQTRGCACSSPTALFDSASNSCVEVTTTPEPTTNAPTTTPEPSTSTTTTTPEPFMTPQPHNTTGRLYYPSGVQRNVPKDALVGWTLCYSALYDDNTASIENILAACGPMDLMMIGASEVRDPENVAVLAARQTGDFFSNKTHTRADTHCTRFDLADRHQHNGAWWYNIDGSALGFAAKPNIYPCSGDDELDDCENRVSWHQLDQAQHYLGYRAGCNAAPEDHFMKLVWKASNPCTLPGHVPSYLNGDFVGCVCEDPLAEFDDVAGECYVPCTGPLRQQEGAALGRCECAIEHLQGEDAASCACPDGARLDAEALRCVCAAPGTFLEAASGSCAGCDAGEQAACAAEATCSRTAEGFWCECPEGYEGEGRGEEGCQMVPVTTPLPITCNATQAAACAPEAECEVDGAEAWCHCPAGYRGHGLGPGGCYIEGCEDLLEAARGCNLWVKDDLELGTGDIDGKVCVGGSMRASEGLSLGTRSPAEMACPLPGSLHEYGLVVRGDVKWDHGRKFVGAHCVGGSVVDPVSSDGPLNYPGCFGDKIEDGEGSGCAEVIDFDSDYGQLVEISDQLAGSPDGFHASTAELAEGQIVVALDTADAKHVVEVDATLFEGHRAWGFRVTAVDGGSLEGIETVVLNLVKVPSAGLTIGKYFHCGAANCFDMPPYMGSRMLWNYPGESPLAAAAGAPVEGSMLAPRAPLAGSSSGTFRGQVVVKSYLSSVSASSGFQWQPLQPAQLCDEPPAETDFQAPGRVFAMQAHAAAAPLSEGSVQQTPPQPEPVHQPASATPAWVLLGLGVLIGALCMALPCGLLLRRRERMMAEPAHPAQVFPRADVTEHKPAALSAAHVHAADLELGGAREMV